MYTRYYPRQDITADTIRSAAIFQPDKKAAFKWWAQGMNNQCHWGVPAGSTVLDVGCGDCSSLLEIERQGASAFGTEFDENVKEPAAQLGLSVHIGDIDTLDVQPQSFDIITCNQLLEHVPDPIAFVLRLKTLLKPGGMIRWSTPNIQGWNRRVSQEKWINWHIPFHLHFFSPKSVHILAEKTGMHISSLRTMTPRPWVTQQWMTSLQPRVKNGEKNTNWEPRKPGVGIVQYLRSLSPRQAAILLSSHGLGLLTIPFWRIIDACKKGDSFLITLRS